MEPSEIAAIAGPAHGIAGAISLVAALLALSLTKGGRLHRFFGRLFFWSLTAMFLAGMTFAFLRDHVFLMLAMAIAFYLALSGYRSLYLKPLATKLIADYTYQPGPLDKGAALFVMAVSVAMVCWIILDWSRIPLAPVTLCYALFGVLITFSDRRRFRQGDPDPQDWLFRHIWRMPASPLALVTAFSAANLPQFPDPLRWILPAIGGGALIWALSRHYRRKLSKAKSVHDFATVRIGRQVDLEEGI